MKKNTCIRAASALIVALSASVAAQGTQFPSPARAAGNASPMTVIVVNTTADEDAANATCSLREAIIASNTNAAYKGCAAGQAPPLFDLIVIDSGVNSITLGPTPLPTITGGYVVLSTEDAPGPGLPDRTALSGSGLSVGDDLLTITSSRVSVTGMMLVNVPESGSGIKVTAGSAIAIAGNNFGVGASLAACQTELDSVGIYIEAAVDDGGGASPSVHIYNNTIGCMGRYGVLIEGADDVLLGNEDTTAAPNWIGTTNGGFALPNKSDVGVGRGAQNNRIVNNVIAGNTEHGILMRGKGATALPDTRDNIVAGNRIGLLRSGAPLPNGNDGVILLEGATRNTIGGVSDADRNVISANGLNGVNLVHGDANSVLGNYIGTNISGTAVLTGQLTGVSMVAGSGNVIGCTQACPGVTIGNLIGGNTTGIRVIGGVDHKIVGNQIGFRLVLKEEFTPLANSGAGIEISGATTGLQLGDPGVAHRGNFVGYNGDGVSIWGGGVTGTVFVDNVLLRNIDNGLVIRTDASDTQVGSATMTNLVSENGAGVLIRAGATGTLILNAIIRNNAGYGVLFSDGAHDNVISNTQIYGNGYMGIGRMADSSNNDWSELSVFNNAQLGIDTAITPSLGVSGHIDGPPAWITSASKPDAAHVAVAGFAPTNPVGPSLLGYRVELYRTEFDPSGHGEGKTYLGSDAPDKNGRWSITYADNNAPGCYTVVLRTRFASKWSASEFSETSCTLRLPLLMRDSGG